VKPVLKILDDFPILDKTMMKITRRVADCYACSWGEAIEAATPVGLRRAKRTKLTTQVIESKLRAGKPDIFLLQDPTGQKRWEVYFREIGNAINIGKAVILLAPDKESAEFMQKQIQQTLNKDVGLLHSHQPANRELRQWIDLKCGRIRIAVGTRLAIFAPMVNLGLIIIDEEQSPVYKQDSVPHYNAVGVAKIRAKIEGARLILSSRSPTLESWHQAKMGRIKYILRDTDVPVRQIRIIDLQRVGFIPDRRKMRLSISLEEAISTALEGKGKILLFLNRRGFAIFASCHNCGMVLRCPRCNANLILHFKNNSLICHRCNYEAKSPKICPNCNSGYIRYSGLGTEKLESDLNRLFPQFGIARLDKDEKLIPKDAQIIVATESIFKHPSENFDMVGVIWPDAVLNRPDFRSAEKIFSQLLHLNSLTTNSLIIQTNYPEHYCFQALARGSINLFYETELKFRRQSNLPPFKHIIIVKLRGRQKDKVGNACEELFNILNNANRNKSIKIVSFSKQMPHKKRDRFYEQVLIKTGLVPKTVSFLKKILSNYRRSGIIITVDVDPV